MRLFHAKCNATITDLRTQVAELQKAVDELAHERAGVARQLTDSEMKANNYRETLRQISARWAEAIPELAALVSSLDPELVESAALPNVGIFIHIEQRGSENAGRPTLLGSLIVQFITEAMRDVLLCAKIDRESGKDALGRRHHQLAISARMVGGLDSCCRSICAYLGKIAGDNCVQIEKQDNSKRFIMIRVDLRGC